MNRSTSAVVILFARILPKNGARYLRILTRTLILVDRAGCVRLAKGAVRVIWIQDYLWRQGQPRLPGGAPDAEGGLEVSFVIQRPAHQGTDRREPVERDANGRAAEGTKVAPQALLAVHGGLIRGHRSFKGDGLFGENHPDQKRRARLPLAAVTLAQPHPQGFALIPIPDRAAQAAAGSPRFRLRHGQSSPAASSGSH